MNAADYCAWLDVSGLYLGNYSDAERYQTFEKKISPEGLNARIVFDFLRSSRDGVDIAAWRNHHVHEIDGGLRYRIERTADALAAVGAVHAAEAVRTVQSTNPADHLTSIYMNQGRKAKFDPMAMLADMQRAMTSAQSTQPSFRDVESRDAIASLLRDYVEAHRATLQADVDRYGDVRKEPGFDPERRRRDLEQAERSRLDRESQIETIEKMRPLMERIEQGIAKHGDQAPRKLRSVRRKLLEGRRELAGREANDRLPETQAWLDEFDAFANRHAAVFYPNPVEDVELLARLRDLGDYEYDVQEFGAELTWNSPRGFVSDWTSFPLSIMFPAENAEALSETLDAIDELRQGFGAVDERLRGDVVAAFRDYAASVGGLDRLREWIAVELDETGDVAEAEILRLVGNATLNVESMRQYEERGVTIVAWFPVEWDEEHGLEIPLVGEGGDDFDEDSGDDAF